MSQIDKLLIIFRYWEKRKRNNEAAKKSREAKRQQEYSIRERMLICEQENAMLRQELARLRADRDATRLALANEGHQVPGYNGAEHTNNNMDYGRGSSPQPRMNLQPMQSFQDTNQQANNDHSDTSETKPPPFYGPPPHFQYGNPFGFYVAAYGQSAYHHRYPVPVAMHENNTNGYQQPTSTTERTTDDPPVEDPRMSMVKESEAQPQSTTDKVDEIKAENADLKTKLRDLEQAVSYMRDMTQQQHLQQQQQTVQQHQQPIEQQLEKPPETSEIEVNDTPED